MIGRVVSTKMKNTAVVLVESRKTHALYKKSYQRTKKYSVDDLLGVKEGDIVEFIKVKPISKTKHWRISKVVGKDLVAIGTAKMNKVAKEAIEEAMPVQIEESLDPKIESSSETAEVKVTEPKVKKAAKPKVATPKKGDK